MGYAACHWCHVMAHESFEDPGTAALLNEHMVAVKVDREERPDVDAVYMTATQAMTGQGGWPMTVVMTPGKEPFLCGTYLPRPHFQRLVTDLSRAWRTHHEDVTDRATQIAAALAENAAATARALREGSGALQFGQASATAVDGLRRDYDTARGGFGGAPKFPPSMVLEFLLRHHERTGSAAALEMVELTCDRMARGGMYDQLAGGFARYSVDAHWVVPHFEKMLYDNALLLRAYAHLHRVTGSPLALRVADETAAFLLRDLATAEGGFASALDADTDGVEGKTYAWTPAQLRDVLGAEDGAWAAELLTVTAEGTFEHGASTLQLREDPADPARWGRVRAALLAARAQRPQPARDDKVVTAWNGLAIVALAEGGATLDRPAWVAAAARAADLLLDRHVVAGRLRRSSRGGGVGAAAGVLEDYAALADGLLALHQATGAPRWLAAATDLLDVALTHFVDGDLAYDTADDAEALLHRPREITDNASPCGGSALASALLTASVLTDHGGRYREAAEVALHGAGTLLREHPRFAGHWLTAAEAQVMGPLQVAVAGDGPDLLARARRIAPGGTVIVAGPPDAPGVPLLAARPLVDGAPAAYVCRGFVCDRPVTTPDELAAAVRQR